MQQIPLPLPRAALHRVQAVETALLARGWERETMLNGRARWYLPGTAWYLRATWHTTTLYQRVGVETFQRRHFNTADLGAIILAVETAMLAARIPQAVAP